MRTLAGRPSGLDHSLINIDSGFADPRSHHENTSSGRRLACDVLSQSY